MGLGKGCVHTSLFSCYRASQRAAAPQLSVEPLPTEFFEGIGEAANTADIRSLMKDREWLWGNKEQNVGWFIQRGLHLVEGKEGTGKTRWIMDLARRWSLDMRWPDGSKTEMDPDAKVLLWLPIRTGIRSP